MKAALPVPRKVPEEKTEALPVQRKVPEGEREGGPHVRRLGYWECPRNLGTFVEALSTSRGMT